MPLMSRRDYAAYRGVTRSAVSLWVARQHLTPPAVRPDGLIDSEAADEELAEKLDLVRHLGQGGPGGFGENPRAEKGARGGDSAASQIQKARTLSALVDAERKRRTLEAERGKYLPAAAVEAEWARAIANFVQAVEGAIPDLAARAGLRRDQTVAVKRWWREQRERLAARFAAEAAEYPEFVADDDAA